MLCSFDKKESYVAHISAVQIMGANNCAIKKNLFVHLAE